MTLVETDDYESDQKFGQWLRNQRVLSGLAMEEVAKRCGVSTGRIRSLELGYAEKGITRLEAERICGVYKIALSDFLNRASGNGA